MQVHLFVPCFIDQVAPDVAWSTVRILEHLGHRVVVPQDQTCCGQPALNTGFREEGIDVARSWIRAFRAAEVVVAPSGSCVGVVRHHYPDLFAGTTCESMALELSERTYELSEFLVDVLGVEDLGARYSARASYHDACHGLHELGIAKQARKLLANVEGLELVEMDRADLCCGFGGTFSVKLPELSVSMADRKLTHVEAVAPDVLISSESTCLMHLQGRASQRKLPLKTLHLAQVLDPAAGTSP